jgi:hypothetical protein
MGLFDEIQDFFEELNKKIKKIEGKLKPSQKKKDVISSVR